MCVGRGSGEDEGAPGREAGDGFFFFFEKTFAGFEDARKQNIIH